MNFKELLKEKRKKILNYFTEEFGDFEFKELLQRSWIKNRLILKVGDRERDYILKVDLNVNPGIKKSMNPMVLDCTTELESRVLSRLDGIEGIPKLFKDFGFRESPLYEGYNHGILKEYIEGKEMHKEYRDIALAPKNIIDQIKEIKRKCWEREIYNRDVRTHNIILRKEKPIIFDWDSLEWIPEDLV